MKLLPCISALSMLSVLSCQSPRTHEVKPVEPVVVKVTSENPRAAYQSIEFASDPSWDTVNASGRLLGKAQTVYLNDTSPSPRPPDAWSYQFPHQGWATDRTAIPNASWIWGPANIMRSMSAELSEFTFRKQFSVKYEPIRGVIYVAVDDAATVKVNGSLAGSVGSMTSHHEAGMAQAQLKKIDISHLLRRGENEILVQAQNGPHSFADNPQSDSWSDNPAGVIFGGTIQSGNPPPLRSPAGD